jgi:ribosomal-protein-serine acetyltransferase
MTQNSLLLAPMLVDKTIKLVVPEVKYASEIWGEIDADRCRLSKTLPWISYIKCVEDERKYLARCAESFEKGSEYNYVILDARNDSFAGFLTVFRIDRFNLSCELGYWICRRYEGQGVMRQALSLIESAIFSVG